MSGVAEMFDLGFSIQEVLVRFTGLNGPSF